MANSVERRLAAILAADVAGYSRLMSLDETKTRARFNAQFDEIVKPAIVEHRGRLVKTMGDGFLVEFSSLVDAVQCAADIQHGVTLRQSEETDDRKMLLRIGIHLGDVIVEDEDIHGDGVNIAARLEALAEAGGICVSGMVHEGVRNKLSLGFDDLGDQSLKNIADPVRTYRVVLDVSNDAYSVSTDASFRRPAVAVLPFDNLSGDPDQEYFADGLTEDIITALSSWRYFPVIARNSTFAYKGTSPDIRKVGEELGARYVVEGSVRMGANRVRVTAQVINAETGHHVWAERFDRERTDIFELQDEITREIAKIIEPAIARAEHQRIVAKPPSDLAAWEYCVRGFTHIYELTPEANKLAREMFERAIELDPQYCRAHTGLAYTYGRDTRYHGTPDLEEWNRRMLESALRAVSLDETDAEARTMLARAYWGTGQLEAAIAEAKKAVQLNPYSAEAANILGGTLSTGSGRFEEGIPWCERALKLSPSDPQQHMFTIQLTLACLGAGRYEEAVELARDAVRRRSRAIDGVVALAASLGHLGRAEEARTAIKGYEGAAPGFVEEHLLYAPALKERVLDGLHKAGLAE